MSQKEFTDYTSSDSEYPWRDEETLRRLYWEKGMSLSETADELDCATTTALKYMEKYDIPRRNREDLSTEERFWEKVEKGEPDECWTWTASIKSNGYGGFWYEGTMERAHRVSYELAHGEVGDDYVLHTCDTPSCVNPDHLYLGDQQQNVEDMWERTAPDRTGESGQNAKLKESDVEEILELLESGESQRSVAAEFGVTQGTIWKIANGESWPDVTTSE